MKSMQYGVSPQWRVFGGNGDIQTSFDVAVIMPTVVRPEILQAVQSIYDQSGVDRIQILIGVDKPLGEMDALLELLSHSPEHVTSCFFYPGYSTSVRNGGLYLAQDGGVLRTTLTHLANAKYVAYLDDDNWWGNTHLSDLLLAVDGHDWAYSLRWFVHPETRKKICVDEWESVGPGKGVFVQKFGGFVDTNCLLLNKLICWPCVALWNLPLNGDPSGMSTDRTVFNYLSRHSKPGETRHPSVFYAIHPKDSRHNFRLQRMGKKYAEAGTFTGIL